MTVSGAPAWSIPVQGPVAEGECVRIGWPEGSELDAITALRNRSDVRRQFLDRRVLDPDRNREWLRRGMNRPYEAVLAIRIKADDAFVGVIGWSKGDAVERSFELGRVMVDARKLVRYRSFFPAGYPGVAVDAGIAMRDFAFTILGLELVRMTVIEGNRLSLQAAIVGGGRVVGTRIHRRDDGGATRLIDLECSREDWLRLGARHLGRFGPGATGQTPVASVPAP